MLQSTKLSEHGYEIHQSICSDDECTSILSRIDSGSDGGFDKAGTRGMLDLDWCRDLAHLLAKRLSPSIPEFERARPIQCTYFNKTSANNWLVAYHQDRSVPLAQVDPASQSDIFMKEGMSFTQGPAQELEQLVALRLHLDASSDANGPLRVIPGSHLGGILSSEAIQHWRVNHSEATLIASRGGVIALRPLLLHASSKSTSDLPRRVLHFLFATLIS